MTSPERITSSRAIACEIGISHTAILKAERVGRISREADGFWDVERVLNDLIASAVPGRSPLATPGDATPLGWLTLARLALGVEAQRLTDEGLRVIGIDPNEGDAVADTAPTVAPDDAAGEGPAPANEAAQAAPLTEENALMDQLLAAPAATPRANLRDAATAVLAAWDDQADRFGTHEGDMIGALDAPIAALRALLAGKPARTSREPGAPRKPREGTKQEQVLAMLRRPEGATVAQIAEATGWAQHTVRGFFAGLKKKGHAVEVKSRERMVGPSKIGAKGSFTIYALPK